MPRWARFVSCTFTGLLLSLTGFFLAAFLREGETTFWPAAFSFLSTAEFWYLVLLFAALAGATLLLARLAVHLYGLHGATAGLLVGVLLTAAYALFLVATHAAAWGGMLHGLARVWPDLLYLALPFALTGAFVTWLWDRLA